MASFTSVPTSVAAGAAPGRVGDAGARAMEGLQAADARAAGEAEGGGGNFKNDEEAKGLKGVFDEAAILDDLGGGFLDEAEKLGQPESNDTNGEAG